MYRLERLNDDASNYRLIHRNLIDFVENDYRFLIHCDRDIQHIMIGIGCIASKDITTPPRLPEITVPDNCTYSIDLFTLFSGYENLKTIGKTLDSLIPHDAHIININHMFAQCTLLYEADIMNRLRLPNLKNAACLFYGCRFLTDMHDFLVGIFRRSKTINVEKMIRGSTYDSNDYRWPQPDD